MFRGRFLMALGDLGVLGIVGRDWVRIGDGGLKFTPLPFTAADALLRRLQDVACGSTDGLERSCTGQQALDV